MREPHRDWSGQTATCCHGHFDRHRHSRFRPGWGELHPRTRHCCQATHDVDLFASPALGTDQFQNAVATCIQALREHGYDVTQIRSFPLFARLQVIDSDNDALEIDLAINWRAHPPVTFSLGPYAWAQDLLTSPTPHDGRIDTGRSSYRTSRPSTMQPTEPPHRLRRRDRCYECPIER